MSGGIVRGVVVRGYRRPKAGPTVSVWIAGRTDVMTPRQARALATVLADTADSVEAS